MVNKIGQQVYLWRGEHEGGTPSHHHYLVTWLWQILISQILMHSDVQMNRYFSEPCDSTVMTLLAPGKEFSFVTTVKKKIKIYVSLFSGKEFLIYKFKLLSLLKRLYSMSSTAYIYDPLPVTPWCPSVAQTWLTKPLLYLGMKL